MISMEDMRSELWTVDKARETLAASEPLLEYPLNTGNTSFLLREGWNHGLDSKEGNEIVDASIVLGGLEVPMTKDAVLQAASLCGLPGALVKRTPARLIEPQLNYWYGEQGLGNRPAKLLVTNDQAAAVTRQSIAPFSNLRMLSAVLDGIGDTWGYEPLVDPKFHHSVVGTYMRVILPGEQFSVGSDDPWFMGISFYNSLTGKGKTCINGYMFRWVCQNGAIDTKATSGTWTRNLGNGDQQGVYDWAREAIAPIKDTFNHTMDLLNEMTEQSIEGDVSQILQDLFEDYKLPARDRKAIIANMVEEDELTMYSLMQAVTDVANSMDMDPSEQAKLMSVGGDLPYSSAHRCSSCHRINKA